MITTLNWTPIFTLISIRPYIYLGCPRRIYSKILWYWVIKPTAKLQQLQRALIPLSLLQDCTDNYKNRSKEKPAQFYFHNHRHTRRCGGKDERQEGRLHGLSQQLRASLVVNAWIIKSSNEYEVMSVNIIPLDMATRKLLTYIWVSTRFVWVT